MLTIRTQDSSSDARTGILKTSRGEIETPVFMPVGTNGAVKMLTPEQVKETGAQIILGNTYHLMIRPGTDVVESLGGLHSFSGWDRSILTDSGGFQVFSLAALNKITDKGVRFRSHVDGREIFLTPENVIEAQTMLGSDIAMVLDVCPPADASRVEVESAVDRTVAWAKRSLDCEMQDHQVMFAIVQGGRFADLRCECAQQLAEFNFHGYACGGVSVGEEREIRRKVMKRTAESLPADRPRYVMGLGEPVDLLDAVEYGYDMFDCVLPTRNGRNGSAFTFDGGVNIRNSRYISDNDPVEEGCRCYCCRHFSRGYIRHLFNTGEALGPALLSIHNITFFMEFMRKIRESVEAGLFSQFRKTFSDTYYQGETP